MKTMQQEASGRRRALLAGVIVLVSGQMVVGSVALALSPTKTMTQYAHRVWTPDEGLPQVTVQAMVQTRDGYIWIGTRGGGVATLVGNGVKRFNLGLSANQENVKAAHEEADGTLWFATTGGLIRLADGKTLAFTIRDGLAEDNVHQVLEDDSGNL